MTTSKTVPRTTTGMKQGALGVFVGALALLAAASALASNDAKVDTRLTPTANASSAHGRAQLRLKSGTAGKFAVSAGHLAPGRTFDVVVGGVKVGSFQTSAGGTGRKRFSTKPHGSESVLGFDPRGMSVSVRDAQTGDDDLVTDIPDDNPGDGACCVTNGDGEPEYANTIAGRIAHAYTYTDPETGETAHLVTHDPLLFDVTVDGGESYDVSERHPEVTSRLAAAIGAWERDFFANPRGWRD